MDAKEISFEELLDRDGEIFYRTDGTSMRPLIKTGRDLVVITKKDGRLKKYDVGFFRASDKYVLHRVLMVRDVGYITAGDNNCFRETVAEDDMLGVMTRIKRKDKEVKLDGAGYRIYSRLWGGNFTLRRLIVSPYRRLRRAAAKVFHRIKGD